ncbi:hypothetical protein [Nocardia crassostreae]|uniref:hypothetical protein n=1 Tax=Nocardia crassostreae TaxID=53428 RepID=UPI0012F97376|nr:hypothetical protein [Nocardia crassostreae]
MVLQNNRLGVLVLGNDGWPELVPLDLFSVVDGALPSGWEFVAKPGFRTALWGYPTLVRDPEHIGALRARKQEARDVFLAEAGAVGFDEKSGKFFEYLR